MAPAAPRQPAPTLRDALAVALLLKRRCAAAVKGAEERCAQLEAEAGQLRAAASAPPPPPPPQPALAQLVDHPPAAAVSQAASAGPASLSHEALQQQQQSLVLWHQAAAALPPELQPALGQAQRYVLLKELQEASGAGSLPAAAALSRTPVRACTELAADILEAHAAASSAAAAGASPQLSPAHGQLLAAALDCLVQLCNRPGEAMVNSDLEAVQRFCCLALPLAAAPPAHPTAVPTPDQPSGPSAQQGPGVTPVPATGTPGPADLLQQPTSQLAEQALAALRRSPRAGITLLCCCAPATLDCLVQLVQAVTGEPLQGSASMPGGLPAAATPAQEAALLHGVTQLSQQVSVGLRLLPQWMQAAREMEGAHFMQVGCPGVQ